MGYDYHCWFPLLLVDEMRKIVKSLIRSSASAFCAISVIAVAVSGCAGVSNAGGHPEKPQMASAVKWLGPVDGTIDYASAGITLTAAPKGVLEQSIPWESLLASCDTGDAICDTKVTPTVTMGLATSGQIGDITEDGKLAPLFESRPVYVMAFDDALCYRASGGKYIPDKEVQSAQIIPECQMLNFYDASTGEVLFSSKGTKGSQP